MAAKRVRCPRCAVVLDVPAEYKGWKIRCSSCDSGFRMPGISDAEILDWIGPENKEDTAHAVAAEAIREEKSEESSSASKPKHRKTAKARVGYPAGGDGFYLVRITRQGAIFEFPADMLKDPAFRCAMPRRCLRCGDQKHVHPRVIIFSHQMKDCSSIESEFLQDRSDLSEREARNMSIEEVIEHLPKIRNIPSPADLPMPYWICDMCTPSKMLFAQNRINTKTHEGNCRLQIHRLWRAEEFLINAGGKNTEAHDEILDALEDRPEIPWDMLAGVIQQRLRQWYCENRGERFVSYTPDRTHSRTEDGMAGIVISSRRLVYNSSLRHRESEKGEPLELDFGMEASRLKLHIKSPNWQIKNMFVDKAGLERLRRALTREKFNAIWR